MPLKLHLKEQFKKAEVTGGFKGNKIVDEITDT